MKYKSGYKYQLHEDFNAILPIYPDADIETQYIDLDHNGLILIKEGYAWDGASSVAIDTENIMVPSLVHDALYQLMRNSKLPHSNWKHADEIFEMLCRDRRMLGLRARWLKHGLSLAEV